MALWDSITRCMRLGRLPAGPLLVLAGVALLLTPLGQHLENATFDLLQRLQRHTSSPDIILINTSSWRADAPSIWDVDEFPDLLEALGTAGARLILTAEAPPLTARLPDTRQLVALADLERRRADRGSLPMPAPSEQWSEMTRRSELHARTTEVVTRLGNLIIALPLAAADASSATTSTSCSKPPAGSSGNDTSIGPDTPWVAAIARIPDDLCQSAMGTGHVVFRPEADGVVRHLDLVVNAAGTAIDSALLHATGYPETISPGSIAGRQQLFLRFYPVPASGEAFATVTAEELLRNPEAAARIAGKIVILGDTARKPGTGYHTPLAEEVPAAVMLATGLSNLLAQDYIVRPGWMAPAEVLLLLLAAAVILRWELLLPPALAAMTGLLSASALLGTQSYLLELGFWIELGAPATLALICLSTAPLRPLRTEKDAAEALALPQAAPTGTRPQTMTTATDDPDLAFSVLRHQPPGENVKHRLYELALSHARQHDLARAERVLHHLAAIDPGYRRAGEKLKKLTGMKTAAPAPPGAARSTGKVLGGGEQDLSGQTIGRYQLERVIGRGAMATVYLGRDPNINRHVAIKAIALAVEFSDADLDNARDQFLREAESAGRLNHPCIIGIYDAGEDGHIAYLAMEYFPGQPLSQFAQPGRLLPPQQVIGIIARTAEALHYAHGQRVVHRDIKPANLLYDMTSDTLKITDFGIARLTDSSRTRTGIILGTPSYMSPEQLAGSGVTGQSDLFSLGVTLYHLLVGTPPFRADSISLLMQKIAHQPHPPLTTVRNDLPPAIHAVIDRALAKDPAHRFTDGRAMALALRDCCSSVAASAAVRTP